MSKKWLRMVDSAQRRITIENPHSPSCPELEQAVIEIQGIVAHWPGNVQKYPFADMAEMGIHLKGVPSPSILDRLRRKPTWAGDLTLLEDNHLLVAFWTQPQLDFIFNLEDGDQAALWRECEIMTMSAGFHFRQK